ncbi:MAG: Mobile element protein, partial [Acidobacteriaceae bacterium]|nr:Mobile element protein [Acidobacteriaceae bacterium]
FVADQLQDGIRFRSLTVVDVYTQEAVAIEVGRSLKGDDVVRTSGEKIAWSTHRSAVVNLDRIGEIYRDGVADGTVVLKDGSKLKMSRAGRQKLVEIGKV